MTKYENLVWRILVGMPVEIVDEETNSILEGGIWELVTPRTLGDYKGKSNIGAGNLISAYNLLATELVRESSNIITIDLFREIINNLAEKRLIRKKPELMRKKFKVVK